MTHQSIKTERELTFKCQPVMDWGPAVSEAPSLSAQWGNCQQNPNGRKAGHPESKRVAINWRAFGWFRDILWLPFVLAPSSKPLQDMMAGI